MILFSSSLHSPANILITSNLYIYLSLWLKHALLFPVFFFFVVVVCLFVCYLKRIMIIFREPSLPTPLSSPKPTWLKEIEPTSRSWGGVWLILIWTVHGILPVIGAASCMRKQPYLAHSDWCNEFRVHI